LNQLAYLVKEKVESENSKKIDIIHSNTDRADNFSKVEQPKISSNKAREILGYAPKFSLEKGIQELINYYKHKKSSNSN